LPRPAHAAGGQTRIVGSDGFCSNEHGVHACAQLMCVAPSIASGDPSGLTRWARQSSIERHAAFCDYKGPPRDDPFVERFVKPRALFCQNPIPHSDACVSQFDHASAGVPRIQVCRAYDYISKSSLDYRIGTRRSAPGCGTRLQSHVKRSPRGNRRAEIAQTINLTMSAACFPMMSFCDYAIINHQDGSNGGVGTCPAERLFCFSQSSAHELFVSVGRHGAGESVNTCLEGFEPQPSDPKFCVLTLFVMRCNVPL
jgi:hypothetical protein